RRSQVQNALQAAHRGGKSDLPTAQEHGGTCLRQHQRSDGLPTVFAARTDSRRWRMEPGLCGLQSETSSCIALGLILRAHKPKGGADEALKRTQNHDYVYSMPLIEPVSLKIIAANSILFHRCCLSDSLLACAILFATRPQRKCY